MFSLFRKQKATIYSIGITDLGWPIIKNDTGIIQWMNPAQTIAVSVNFFDLPPDIPAVKDIHLLRNFYRNNISGVNGGVIEVDLSQQDQLTIIKTLFKIPQARGGTTYLASLTLPFKTCSYVLKVQSAETGPTGMRETLIADKLLSNNRSTSLEERLSEWSADPYAPHFKKGILMNQSEDEIYDALFPNHPLTQARKIITQIKNDIKLKPEIGKLLPFYS
jgi:hypothetical protein